MSPLNVPWNMTLCRIFRFFRLSRPRAPHQKFSLKTENNKLNKMTLGHLDQFDEIHCNSKKHKVLSIYILMFGFFCVVHCVWRFQVHMFNSAPADISRFWSILGILEPFAFSVFLFCHPFGGRDSPKKRKIHEANVELTLKNFRIPKRSPVTDSQIELFLTFSIVNISAT